MKTLVFNKVPAHTMNIEADALTRFMATLELPKISFLYKPNQLIFSVLDALQQGRHGRSFVGTTELITALKEGPCSINLIPGGEGYVRKVFGDLEPLEDAV